MVVSYIYFATLATLTSLALHKPPTEQICGTLIFYNESVSFQ
jgi:hypothetical protein